MLVLGLAALGMALRYAFSADGRLRPAVEALGRSVLFFSLSGFVTGLVASGAFFAKLLEEKPASPAWEIFLLGAVESSNNLALGFTLLALTHLALAVGARRESVRGA